MLNFKIEICFVRKICNNSFVKKNYLELVDFWNGRQKTAWLKKTGVKII